ncbi:cytochrome P450 [Candidatus Cyanaurora vandensis]|uniref:cytochrome P450 n=1 Tax=Candidatus Cyanaurora vandensis TaxID=2714958 RepID=UPI00257E38A8|nr:cytochrome P450 [Candidatus Cyanaurora vandensis]
MKLPPGSARLPLLELMDWINRPLAFLEDTAARYGDPFTARFGIWEVDTLVFFSNPKAIQELYATDSRQFSIGQANTMLQPLLGDHSVLLLDGELNMLMAAVDETGAGMSDQELRDELITLLVAGHETTATALTWALYWVHHTPGVHAKLLSELIGTNPAQWGSLPYLTAVSQETLRLYPVALIGFGRVVKEPFTFQGYTYPTDTALIPCIYLTHHRPEIYPQSKQFRPERFLERQFTPYEYMPFGGANRRCLGMAFALYELKLVLAAILLRVDLELCTQADLQPVRRSVTLSPPADFQMVVRTRRQVEAPV